MKAKKKSAPKLKPFADQTPREKRITIAEDVLGQLAAKKFIATSGVYCRPSKETGALAAAKCEVCGIGSLLTSCLLKEQPSIKVDTQIQLGEDAFEKPRWFDFPEIAIKLEGIFTEEQLTLIEDAFEDGMNDVGGDVFFEDSDGNTHHFDDGERLRLIMENIVVNKGTFIPDPDHRNHFKVRVLAMTPGL